MRAPDRAGLRVLLSCLFLAAPVVGCSEDSAPQRNTDEDNAGDGDEGDDGDEGGEGGELDSGTRRDGGRLDAGNRDAARPVDGGGAEQGDGGANTSEPPDAGLDGGSRADAGEADAGEVDAGDGRDAGGSDAGPASSALCNLAGNQVAVLGDSYIQLSGDFTRLLQEHAREAGALGSSDTYVDHALSGASMNGFPNIPSQLPNAIADAKRRGSQGIKLVIMTGGGNDVLINNRPCLELESVAAVEQNASCVETIDNTLETAQALFDDGVAEGIEAVVYFFYPHLPESSVGAGPNANNILDYSIPRARELCEEQTKAPCYFIDMRPAFNDPQNDGWPREGLIAFDGIHPTLRGSQILADEVWKVMQAQCLASQPKP